MALAPVLAFALVLALAFALVLALAFVLVFLHSEMTQLNYVFIRL